MQYVHLTLAALFFITFGGQAFADSWDTTMLKAKDGKVMVAQVLLDGAPKPALRVLCADNGKLGVRYLPEPGVVSMQSSDGTDFLFENEHGQLKETLKFSRSDESYGIAVPAGDPLIQFIETGETLYISESAGDDAAQSFPLAGATKAIEKIKADCA